MRKTIPFLIQFLLLTTLALAQQNEKKVTHTPPAPVRGVFPNLTVVGQHEGRSESGIGALIPWADKLWMIGYVAHIRGSRIGLYQIDEDMTMIKHPESVTGTFANRMVHNPSDQAIIGPHFIDTLGRVRTCKALSGHRLTATMEHLTERETKVLFLTMEGLLYEADVRTLEANLLFDLVKELDIPPGAQPHFKGGFTGNGRVIVANNSYYEKDHLGEQASGRLAEWDGKQWIILERNPFMEVNGKLTRGRGGSVYGSPIFATGWDKKSVLLKCFNEKTNAWKTYRLPKGSHSFDHAWNTEWMRIREAQTERYLMDIHGIFYELPIMTYGGDVWGIKPISYHLRMVPDFCFWRGMLVLAGDQTDHAVGQPQSGLLFQNIDDLWQYGKPTGWGSVWWEEPVKAGRFSDPFLMTGFDKKVLHLSNESNYGVTFTVEIDFLGNGNWKTFGRYTVPSNDYRYHIFPDGFSAHWVRLSVNKDCKATATFMYQ